MTDGALDVERFYVYRSLHRDESWGAIITNNGSIPNSLPNIDFGMKIYARNEKEAITRGKFIYDKIHVLDSDKENIRRFAATVLKTFTANGADAIDAASQALKYAIELNKQYNEYFSSLEKGDNNE